MHIGMIGISYFSSPLSLREKVAKVCREQFSTRLKEAKISHVLLSTCNRTEIYFASPHLTHAHSKILQILRKSMDEPFDQALYSYFRRDCFHHLGRVISGMDSVIFGESDIQRQAKIAYESARMQRKLPPSLHYLFQKGLKTGKEMRTALLPSHTRLPTAIYSLLKRVKNPTRDKRFLFIGNSGINRIVISFFLGKGNRNLSLCTRTEGRPIPSVQLKSWEALDKWFEYDVIVAGTYHHEHIIKPSDALKRVSSPILLFDLGVPRNIDPALGQESSLHLYNIDDLSKIANQTKKTSEKEIQLCETMINKIVERQLELFYQKQSTKSMAPSRANNCQSTG